MKFILFLTIIFLCQNLYSQQQVSSINDWENPSIFEKGQNPPHAFHIPHNNLKDAILNNTKEIKYYKLLNGQWKFKWFERPELAPEDFADPRFKVESWGKIKVPSNWQMEGYGHPKFRNIALTFESDPPNIPDYYNPTGLYKRKFNIPVSWKNREIMLRFEGIKSASYVYINGEEVGYNEGGFEPAEFNITPYIRTGNNDISVKVIRFSDGSYLENQDMWRLSGIFRDVKLYSLPGVHIQDFYQYTELDENYINATLKVEVDIKNNTSSFAENHSLEIDVLDTYGNSILNKPGIIRKIQVNPGDLTRVKLQSEVINPEKWSAESPNLYNIIYILKNEKGNILETFTKKLGFREIELKNGIFMINGVAVKLNGVNSHMHHPEHGQAVPIESLKKDLLIMKQFNINCVRTCHYPPSPEYLDLADRLGIYIVDEVGDEAHKNTWLSEDSSYTEMYRDRSRKLVYRDRNHASVIMWSAGNESGKGFNIDEVIKTGKSIDPNRPAWMYGGNTFYLPFEDVIGPRYWIPYQLKNLAKGEVLEEDDIRPSFMDEYLAATGNGLGGLDEYWALIRKYPRLIGGAIWDWVSPGIKTPLWIIPDTSPKKNNGAIMGRPIFVDGRNGRALSLSGHDDWIEFYRDSSLDITSNEITLSFWIKPKKIPQPQSILTKGKRQYGIIMSSPSTLEFYVQSNNLNALYQTAYYKNQTKRISAVADVPDDWYGNWHHVAGIYDGESLKLFIDEEEVARTEYSGDIAHSPFPLCIGREAESQDQGEYSGRMSSMIIDDVQIHHKAIDIDDLNKEIHSDALVLFLDFESDKKSDDFYSVGLGGRTYGIIWPDRNIQPEIHQIKKSGQPIQIEAVDLETGRIKIINYHHFTDLNEYDLKWEILREGKLVENGELTVELAAGKETKINIPYSPLKVIGEVILNLSFCLKRSNLWAEAGHEVAWEQFIITKNALESSKIEDAGISKITFQETDHSIIIEGKDFEYRMDKSSGEFIEFRYKGHNLLEGGPLFNIWRAPLANDIDPWGSVTFEYDKQMPGLGRSIDNQLRAHGMRNLTVEIESIEIQSINEGSVSLKIHKFNNASNFRGAFESFEEYKILTDGSIEVQLEILPHGRMPEMFPRAGWQFKLAKELKNIEWYGRGPFENYPDRKTAAKVGIYTSDIDREYVPYIIPQDYGNHTDVRWLKAEDPEGKGILIKGDDLLNFSYQKYSTENLSRAMYTYQLKETGFNTLNIDFEVSGVGGTAVRQLQKYRVSPKAIKFNLTIVPYVREYVIEN